MDQKHWLWRKRSVEKTIVTNGTDLANGGNREEEVQSVPSEKEMELEKSLNALHEKLASVLDECTAKDKLLESHAGTAKNAMAEKEEAEKEVQRLKEELNEALHQKQAANKRSDQLNKALKDCMEQLNALRSEQEQRVHDAITKAHKKLEEKLTEASKRLAALTIENSYLSKTLIAKENLIEELTGRKDQAEAEFDALMTRLDSTEKENSFLRYEYRMLEKELDLRNNEVEYARQSVESLNKQHMENVKKIKKLEADCQRLRALTRQRLPGPALLANMKHEVEMHGKERRRKSSSVTGGLVVRDPWTEHCPDIPSKKLKFLVDCLHDLEKENKILKEVLARKDDEICFLRKGMKSLEGAAKEVSAFQEKWGLHKMKENEATSPCSWASAAECKMIGAPSDMSLMDDFLEMEKLAIVSVAEPVRCSCASDENHLNLTDKELVPVTAVPEHEMRDKPSNWLQNVLKLFLKEKKSSGKSLDELLGEIETALKSMNHIEPSETFSVTGYLTWKSSSPRMIPSQNITKSLQDKMNSEYIQPDVDNHTIRDEFEKFLGGTGPGTALELESVQNLMTELDKIYFILRAENEGLRTELNGMKLSKKELETSLSLAKERNKAFAHELKRSLENVKALQTELESVKEKKKAVEDEVEDQKLVNEDLGTQLSVSRSKLNEALQKLASVEVELDYKSHCCQELEGTCLELQLQLESISTRQVPEENDYQEEKLLRADLEFPDSPTKLANCEEKQPKAQALPEEALAIVKVPPVEEIGNDWSKKRKSLLDMLSEHGLQSGTIHVDRPAMFLASPEMYIGLKQEPLNSITGALVLVPTKKQGRWIRLLGKLLLKKKKKGSSF